MSTPHREGWASSARTGTGGLPEALPLAEDLPSPAKSSGGQVLGRGIKYILNRERWLILLGQAGVTFPVSSRGPGPWPCSRGGPWPLRSLRQWPPALLRRNPRRGPCGLKVRGSGASPGSWRLHLAPVLLELGVHHLEGGQEVAQEEDQERDRQHKHLARQESEGKEEQAAPALPARVPPAPDREPWAQATHKLHSCAGGRQADIGATWVKGLSRGECSVGSHP